MRAPPVDDDTLELLDDLADRGVTTPDAWADQGSLKVPTQIPRFGDRDLFSAMRRPTHRVETAGVEATYYWRIDDGEATYRLEISASFAHPHNSSWVRVRETE